MDSSFPIEHVPQPLSLKGTYNTRELGGYPTSTQLTTQSHVFLRSDSLHTLTPEAQTFLLDYGVTCIIDLRSTLEVSHAPCPLANAPAIAYHHLPLLDDMASNQYAGSLPNRMGEVYVKLLKTSGQQFSKALHIMAEQSGITLFNCTAGKDRTGLTAMLLLLLAEVAPSQILADYSVSEKNMQPVFSAQINKGIPAHIFSSAPEELDMAMTYLSQEFGNVRNYLLAHGSTDEDFSKILKRFVG